MEYKINSTQQTYTRPIYKQIISGICYGVVFSLLLAFIIMIILAIIPFYNTTLGRMMIILISLFIGIPAFIEIFRWSLK